MERLRAVVELLEETYEAWREARAVRLGAAIAYYGIVAAVPTLTIFAALTARFLSLADLEDLLTRALLPAFGPQTDTVVATLLRPLEGFNPSSLGLVGLGGLLFAATVLVIALQDAFDMIWQAPVRPGIGLWLRRRAVALGVVAAAAAALLVSLALQTALDTVAGWLLGVQNLDPFFGDLASFVVVTVGLILLFRLLPSVPVPWTPAIVGGVVTAPFVVVGTWGIGLYLQHVAARSASGVAGGAMLVLVWFYYEAQIVLAGAVFTRTLAGPSDQPGAVSTLADQGPTSPRP